MNVYDRNHSWFKKRTAPCRYWPWSHGTRQLASTCNLYTSQLMVEQCRTPGRPGQGYQGQRSMNLWSTTCSYPASATFIPCLIICLIHPWRCSVKNPCMLREHLHEKDGILHSEAPARDHERSLRSGSWVVAIQNRPLGFITKTLEIQNCQTTVDGGEIPHQFIDGYRWCIPWFIGFQHVSTIRLVVPDLESSHSHQSESLGCPHVGRSSRSCWR